MKIAIVGGSLTGLAVANVLHRLGISVRVYEKFHTSFEKRGSSLGFVDVSLWEQLCGRPMMRFGQRACREQGAYFYGDLWQYLFEGLPEGCVRFGHTVETLGNDNMSPTIDGEVFDAVIIADGGWSSLRHYVNGDSLPEYSGMVIWRAKVEAKEMPEFHAEGGFSSGQYFVMMLHVPTIKAGKFIMGGIAVETPESEVTRPNDGASRHTEVVEEVKALPEWFMPFLRRTFSSCAGGEVLRWLETCAVKGRITPLPLYEFKADNVVAGRIILMGDAAHMASPRTAAGAHTGILDAAGLLEAFTAHPGIECIDEAIAAYEPGGKLRALQLYRRSKEVSRPLLTDKNSNYPGYI